jgi:hypothetical protein
MHWNGINNEKALLNRLPIVTPVVEVTTQFPADVAKGHLEYAEMLESCAWGRLLLLARSKSPRDRFL